MSRGLVYFAHPFDMKGTDDEVAIKTRLQKMGWSVIDPFDEYHQPEWIDCIIDSSFDLDYAERLVKYDVGNITRADWVLVWLPFDKADRIIGSICEMVHSYHRQNKYTVVIMEGDRPIHPWVVAHSSQVFSSIHDWEKSTEMSWIMQREKR